VSGAAALAFAAGVCGVLGLWDGLGVVDRRAPFRLLGRWLAPLRSDAAPTAPERRRLAVVGAATLAAGGWLVAGPLVAATLAAAGPALTAAALRARARRRRSELAAGAAGVARALADAVAAGHAVRGAIAAAAPAVGGAAGSELRRAARALELGEPTVAVLEDLRRRAADRGWDTLVAAIILQAGAGGDLAALLRRLAERLDQQRRDAAEARSATAQARFTAWLVAALPLGAALVAELAAPGFLRGLAAEPLTAALGGLSVALQLAAVVAIRCIAGASGSGSR
jgi:tight adherence protein B